jgi:hypothetical protein
MTGFIILGILLVYVVIAIAFTVWAKGAWKWVVASVFLLIPTWDIIPGRIALAHYCEKEGGIKIYRSVDGVEGFLKLDERAYEEYFRRYGYKYVEIAREKHDPRNGQLADTEYVRVTLGEDGKLREQKIDKPVSKYEFRGYRNFDTHIAPWGITLFSASIIDLQSGETIAVDKRFGWYGGWLRRYNRPLLGGGHGCERADDSYVTILLQTLIPAKEFGPRS